MWCVQNIQRLVEDDRQHFIQCEGDAQRGGYLVDDLGQLFPKVQFLTNPDGRQVIPIQEVFLIAQTLQEEKERSHSQGFAQGREKFAPRAAQYDRDATFPFENYDDLRAAGLLKICVPKQYGGLGADFRTYAMGAAEIGRHCGATALTWNMHVCTTLWSGILADELDLTSEQSEEHERHRAIHFDRIKCHLATTLNDQFENPGARLLQQGGSLVNRIPDRPVKLA